MQKTEDQINALNKMLEWSQTGGWRHTLNGAAGTGKTTIAKEFIDRVNIPKKSIAVSAPTHKAKKVIQEATNFNAQTIQKLLGLRPNTDMDNFNPNRPVFLPLGEESIGAFKLILIDESSMINQAAFELIKKRAQVYNVKILFMGDAFQLPPVGENISEVFKGDSKDISVLTTVVRQESTNPMTEILLEMRKDVTFKTQKGVETLTATRHKVFNDTGYKCLTNNKLEENNFGKELLNYYFSTEYEHNVDHMKFITYTNDDVILWSEALRKQLLKEKAKNLINVGERLIGYKSITNKKHNSLIIENSEDYIVTSVQDSEEDADFKGFYVTLKSELNLERTVFIVDTNDKETEEKYLAKVLSLIVAAEEDRRAWKYYYSFVERHLCLKTYKRPGSWKTLISKDLYYAYGMTVHKSQGSTYDNVAINLKNIYLNKKVSERNRLIYVAMSRARNMNIILI